MREESYPGGKQFAFSIIDDTDVATVENVGPVYRLLDELGLGATKTAWPLSCPEGSDNFGRSQTLEDPEYRDFVLDLERRGFEIGWHGATMESSERERTERGLERFRELFGAYPRVGANHSYNRESLYWGVHRIDAPILKSVYSWRSDRDGDFFCGHREESPYWWGDLCRERLTYYRNLTFTSLNLAEINPSMPYHDPDRPAVPWWFSASDAADRRAFNELLQPAALDRLEEDGGYCIVATHFGKGFVEDGRVHDGTRRVLEDLARRDGWFPTVSELLDHLRASRDDWRLPEPEWWKMQWRWAWDSLFR